MVHGEEAQLAAVLEPGFDGRRTVVTGEPLPGLRSGSRPGPRRHARGSSAWSPSGWWWRPTPGVPGELVLTDVHYPGWKVELDGEPADLHRVNYLLRGTTLPAGRHTRGVLATSRCPGASGGSSACWR